MNLRGNIGIAIMCGLLGACAESGADAQDAGAQIASSVSGSEIFIVDLPVERAAAPEEVESEIEGSLASGG